MWGGQFLRAGSFHRLRTGRRIPTTGGRDGDFQELGHYPLFGLLCSAWEWSWCCKFVILYSDVLQWGYNEAQGLLKSSTILGLVFLISSWPIINACVILLKVVPCPLPSCLTAKLYQRLQAWKLQASVVIGELWGLWTYLLIFSKPSTGGTGSLLEWNLDSLRVGPPVFFNPTCIPVPCASSVWHAGVPSSPSSNKFLT